MKTVLLVCGLMGTGKTTFARRLKRITGFDMIRSDILRKELARMDAGAHEYTAFEAGIYSENFSKRTYAQLCHRAGEYLENGRSVIVDAAFSKQWQRDLICETARDSGAQLIVVECVCPDEVVRQRLLAREADGADASDGRWELYPFHKSAYDAFNPSDEYIHLTVETNREESSLEVLQKIQTLI